MPLQALAFLVTIAALASWKGSERPDGVEESLAGGEAKAILERVASLLRPALAL
jgi:hypothetical protein